MPPIRNSTRNPHVRHGPVLSAERFLNTLPAESFDSPNTSSGSNATLSSPLHYDDMNDAEVSSPTAPRRRNGPAARDAERSSPIARRRRNGQADRESPPIPDDDNVDDDDGELPSHIHAIVARNRAAAVSPHVASVSSALSSRANIAAVPSAMDLNQIFVMIDGQGNENTSKTYRGYMKEFVRWTQQQLHYDPVSRACVTEEKLIVFLYNEVVGRENRVRRRNAAPGVTQEIGGCTVLQYISAITKLFFIQQRAGANSFPHPRQKNLKDFIKWIEKDSRGRSRRNKVDRAINTVTDGYSTPEMLKQICNNFFCSSRQVGLRNRASFLLMHYGLWRSETARRLEFADIDMLMLQNEGPMPCPVLMFRADQGKTNQSGSISYSAAMRGRDVEVCAMGALAMFFFQRWHRNNEPFPELDGRDWFEIKVICPTRGAKTDEITPNAHREGILDVKKRLNIKSTKVLHMPRGSGAVMAELCGADVNHIRRHGGWNRQALENFYLSAVPREAVRALAGFPANRPAFFIPRAIHTPPESLQKMIFPGCDKYLDPNYTWSMFT